ncbi:hypothetical protein AYI69_g9276, partial [Smittium culicis]
MEQELIQLIKDLTNKVNIFYKDRERQCTSHEQRMNVQNSDVEDQNLRVRAPAYEVINYPELIEEFPDMEDDIFRSPLKEDGRKEIVYGYPKFKVVNYQPPPLNDTAPTAVKKVDGLLYSIQQSFANITRPIDQYRHEQLRSGRTVDPDNDDDIIAMESIRRLITDQMTYVPTYLNPADAPSRLTAQTEWSNPNTIFNKIISLYDTHDVELFATKRNTKVRNYYIQPVFLYTLEPDPTGITEGEEGEVNINSNNPLLEISNLVPRPVEINSSTSNNTRSICDHPRPQKRKVSYDRQQELITRAMEDQRSSLETEGYSEHAIRLMEPNQRAIKRRTRNSAIQQGFLDWLETNKDRCIQDTILLINYLSEIYSTKSLTI